MSNCAATILNLAQHFLQARGAQGRAKHLGGRPLGRGRPALEIERVTVQSGGYLESLLEDMNDNVMNMTTCWREVDQIAGLEEVEDGREYLVS